VSAERLARCVARLKTRLAKPAGRRSCFTIKRILERKIKKAGDPPRRHPRRQRQRGQDDSDRRGLLFQAADKYTSVLTREGEALIRTPLKELLAQLPRERFRQIHRGTVVNLQEITAAVRDDAGRISLTLRSRKETPVSRLYADLFRQM